MKVALLRRLALAAACSLLLPMAAHAATITTGDLGYNAVYSPGSYLWSPTISNLAAGPATLTVKYGLWNSPDVTVHAIVNTVDVGTFFADNAYISNGPAFVTFDVTGYLVNGVNSILMDDLGASGDYLIGQLTLNYNSSNTSVPDSGVTAALLLVGLCAFRFVSRRRS